MPVEYHVSPPQQPSNLRPPHYYGDIVRRCFLAAGVVMLGLYPFVHTLIPSLPPFFTIAAVLLLALLAGFLNPRQRWLSALDVLAAAGGAIVFAYYGVRSYSQGVADIQHFVFFIANQALALLFLVALYYSSKTVRGQYVQSK